ncbi:MAG: SPOR domain-containing protein [Acetobacteraceae bacterium]
MAGPSAHRVSLVCAALALAGCAGPVPPPADRAMRLAPTVRLVMGQNVDAAPLLPEPGDIWADLAFLKHTLPTATPIAHTPVADTLASHTPPSLADTRAARTRVADTPAPQTQSPESQPPDTQPLNPLMRQVSQRQDVPPDAPVRQAPQPPAAPAAGTILVQLAAAGSEDAARSEWQHLQQRMPDLMAERVALVLPVEMNGQRLWRLRTGGFPSTAEAIAFCGQLQTRHAACWVVRSAA